MIPIVALLCYAAAMQTHRMTETEALQAFSRAEISAIELRRRLGGATYGEVLERLAEAGLSLPRAPRLGREADLARARAWMFPHAHGA